MPSAVKADVVNRFSRMTSTTAFTEDILDAPDSEPVCYCCRVDKGAVLRAMAEGATTLDALQARTGAGSGIQCRKLNPRGR